MSRRQVVGKSKYVCAFGKLATSRQPTITREANMKRRLLAIPPQQIWCRTSNPTISSRAVDVPVWSLVSNIPFQSSTLPRSVYMLGAHHATLNADPLVIPRLALKHLSIECDSSLNWPSLTSQHRAIIAFLRSEPR